ncbi:hypothetical protein B0I35DRAFT_403674 [Stachybotrys elegans]|uniref:SMODS and SLOG-associating 2TM effector domain-containing protein n=1 Tax=Stachybotrys elegans TaxID=80388 RepID=A0A8K0WXA0_9HYPO|nr:hypothetical protein B0I35DRAFT_403674 [Stachybotrys elegans]
MSQLPRASDTLIFSSVSMNEAASGNGSRDGDLGKRKEGDRDTKSTVETQEDTVSDSLSDVEANDIARHRLLPPREWQILVQAVGGVGDVENNTPARITSWIWPPSGLPAGLYRDVVTQRTKYFYMFHSISILRWTMMILQLFIGAALTALGSLSLRDGTSITILGASNTIIAGLLALLHNSGLPDRHKYNMLEFDLLQDHLKELLESRMARADMTIDQVVANCFHEYQEAKATDASDGAATTTTESTRETIIDGTTLSSQQQAIVVDGSMGTKHLTKLSWIRWGFSGYQRVIFTWPVQRRRW